MLGVNATLSCDHHQSPGPILGSPRSSSWLGLQPPRDRLSHLLCGEYWARTGTLGCIVPGISSHSSLIIVVLWRASSRHRGATVRVGWYLVILCIELRRSSCLCCIDCHGIFGPSGGVHKSKWCSDVVFLLFFVLLSLARSVAVISRDGEVQLENCPVCVLELSS
jgi:hypothetical protein